MRSVFIAVIGAGVMIASCVLLGATQGCTKQQGAVVAPAIPAVSSCVARIISDALSGMSRADILADVPTSCASSIVEIDNVIAGYAPSLPAVKRAAFSSLGRHPGSSFFSSGGLQTAIFRRKGAAARSSSGFSAARLGSQAPGRV